MKKYLIALCLLSSFSPAQNTSHFYLCDEFPEASVLKKDDYTVLCVFKKSLQTGIYETSCEMIRKVDKKHCISTRLDASNLTSIFCSLNPTEEE